MRSYFHVASPNHAAAARIEWTNIFGVITEMFPDLTHKAINFCHRKSPCPRIYISTLFFFLYISGTEALVFVQSAFQTK